MVPTGAPPSGTLSLSCHRKSISLCVSVCSLDRGNAAGRRRIDAGCGCLSQAEIVAAATPRLQPPRTVPPCIGGRG